MRIFAAAFIIWCLGAAVAQAGTEVREVKFPSGQQQTIIFVRPFCKFGMQFISVNQDRSNTSTGSGGLEVVQVMTSVASHLPLQPMKCQEDSAQPAVWK